MQAAHFLKQQLRIDTLGELSDKKKYFIYLNTSLWNFQQVLIKLNSMFLSYLQTEEGTKITAWEEDLLVAGEHRYAESSSISNYDRCAIS